jgi:hypothetical protein
MKITVFLSTTMRVQYGKVYNASGTEYNGKEDCEPIHSTNPPYQQWCTGMVSLHISLHSASKLLKMMACLEEIQKKQMQIIIMTKTLKMKKKAMTIAPKVVVVYATHSNKFCN